MFTLSRAAAAAFIILLSSFSTAHAQKLVGPSQFTKNQFEKLDKEFDDRFAQRIDFKNQKLSISTRATRNSWLKKLYRNKVIAADIRSSYTFDKLLMSMILEKYLSPEDYAKYHPKTVGLKAFLETNNLLDRDKNLSTNKEELTAALNKAFPLGYIVKAASSMNSRGSGKFFYFKQERFVDDLLQTNSHLYSASEYYAPFVACILQVAASGEKMIIQENVVTAAGHNKVLKAKEFIEARVHTLEEKVIEDGTYSRWSDGKSITTAQLEKASDFTQDFLSKLPPKIVSQQAWGVDVAVLDNGVLRIIELNTNRGERHHWTGYSSRPNVLGAYTRHIEKNYNIEFVGMSGFLLRNNIANVFKYLKKRYIHGID